MSNPNTTWADHAADRSPSVRRSRARSIQQAQVIMRAAHRLVREKGSAFTTQELARESGVALQTIYRHFPSKDHILLALVEEIIAEQATRMRAAAQELPDPVARLRYYIARTLDALRDGGDRTGPRFITAEHWRLHQLFPDEMARIAKPYDDLVVQELAEAFAQGLLRPRDPAHDAWFAMKLVTSVYHHYAFATAHEPVEDVAERLWAFCLAAFGGPAESEEAEQG
ncbi:TetR/AcrR family transcriptional regulator [Streptomyces sp. NPDC020766]|uniref:TetR/AcrR family transcriptional regulator n=1 Tax=Streptomyces sp. NPDC020766 TaxID=3155011 RepID=UPI0033C1B23C